MTETKETNVELLNTEADFAADFIEEILNIADLEGDIELGIKNGRASVHLVSEDPKALLELRGENGEGMTALQEITRLAVSNQTGARATLLVDINSYREELLGEVVSEVAKAAQEIKDGKEEVVLRPMNSFERKTAHDKAKELGVFSHSVGTGKRRHLVVTKEEVSEEKTEEKETNE